MNAIRRAGLCATLPLGLLTGPRLWANAPGAAAPSPRFAHALAYDAARERVVLFGGTTGSVGKAPMLADTWEWDGRRWLRVEVPGPEPRAYATMAFDPVRNVDARHADLWEWDGRRWQLLTDPYANPNRNHFTMHYDPAKRRVLAFGGLNRRHQATDSMLVLHGNRFHPWEGDRPSPRYNHGLVRLASGRSALLFGGCTRPGDEYVSLGDTWLWDGDAWRRLDGR